MGVQGLWELLAPVGRRVSVETLAGKKLAIDASIWMVQFMKAMRDEKGEMLRNAHILGFFRRICKLLFLRTRPVFVFDGGTPALKRLTIAARRRQRDNARAKIRKTAEKLLLNHLKAKKLEELAAEIKHSKLKDVSKGKQAKDDLKGKRIVHDGESWSMESSFGHAHSEDVGVLTQENLDGLLAASLAAEEERKFTSNEPASTEDNLSKEEADEVEDEEMIYPVTSGNIDPTVLASLPPSVQLDLLVQMRERLMAENRKKYQKIEKAPSKFSQLQIESYLKTVAFRREIDEVQKCAVGRGIGGLQTSRIASEANKEFIFSSFIGDKQKLTSTGFEKIDMDHHALNNSSLNPVNCSSRQSESATTASLGESTKDIGHDVQTNCDEQVHVHVSRVKGLRFGMTRDLQHNLNLLKKYEQENGSKNMCAIPEPSCAEVHDGSKLFDETNFSSKSSLCNEENHNPISENSGTSAQADGTHHFDEPSTLGSQAAMEISFLEDESERKDTDDNVFLHLVYGRSNLEPFNDNIPVNDSDLDSIWEEGVVEGSTATWTDQVKGKNDSSLASRMHLEDDEVDWEDGFYPASKVMSDSQDTHKNAVSIGLSEEEADVQEAIRRSLEDFERLKSVSSNDTNPKPPNGETNLVKFPKKSAIERNVVSTHVQVDTNPSSSCSQCIKAQPDDILQTKYSPKNHHSSNMNFDGESSLNDKANEGLLDSSNDLRRQPIVDDGNEVVSHANNFSTIDTVEVHLKEESLDTFKHGGGDPPMVSREEFAEISANMNLENIDSSSSDKAPEIVLADGSSDNFFRRSYGNTSCQKTSVVEKSVVGIDDKHDQDIVLNNKDFVSGGNCFMGETAIQEPFDVEMSEASLDKEISLLRQERADLGDEQRKLERNAESVSSEMFAECQELLQMFGLPYIIAPMEAEAQCAYMEMKNLVDGVVTDDSDVFLFGARSVYKNIFDDRKYVETYFMKDVESELGLTREKLICMALLLGSDYTEGVSGIGIVNAIEIVNAFPEEDGLRKFREWLESPDPSILGKLDSHIGTNLKKKSSKASKNDADEIRHNVEGSVYEDCISRGHNDQPTSSNISEIKEIFMNKHRNLSKNWHIPSSFPSESVVSAYTSPQVDESTEPFSWGKPDLFLLRKLCWDRFGWSNQKADELLVPVLKEYDKHEIQLRLEAFYTFNERFAKIRSQRIKKAVKGITGTCSSELMDDLVQECSKSRTKRIREENKLENHPDGKITRERKASKPSRRQKTETQDMQIEDGAGESVTSDQDERNARSGFNVDVRGRGKLRGGGRLRKSGRQKGRGRSKVELKFDCNKSTEASSSDDCNGADEMEKLMEMPKDNSELRRSTRRRKQIDFMEENVDADNICCSSTPIDGAAAGDAVEQEPVKNRGKGLVGDAYSIDQEWNQNLLMESCSKDYILTGGGFCIDESDNEGDATQPVVSPERALVESFEERTTNVEDFPGRDDLKSTFKEPSQEDSLVIGTNSNLEQGAAKHEVNPGLRAMPSLKRKRSKA